MGGSSSPLSIGGFLNGVLTNAAAGGNPITGALMNAAAFAGSGGFGGATKVGSFSPDFMSTGKIIQSSPVSNNAGGSLFGFEGPMTSIGRVIEPISAANTFMNENPTTSQIGFSLAKDLLQPSPVSFASPGQVQRGQIQPMDYMSLLNPQQQQVIMPATPSLI